MPAAVAVTAGLGVSGKVVGVIMVALGTSAPEFAATLVAARRGESDVALGNVVGSNLIHLLGVLGVTALLAPIPVDREVLAFDVWVMIATSLFVVPYALRRGTVDRGSGAVFLALAAYVIAQLAGLPARAAPGLPL